MPSVSPSVTASEMSSVTLSAPYDLLTDSSASNGIEDRLSTTRCPRAPSHQPDRAAGRNVLRGLVVDDRQLHLVLLALAPLAEHERRLADVLERALAAPLDRADDGGDIGRGDGVAHVLRRRALAALQRIGRDLEQRMREADRLRPLLLRTGLVGLGKRLRALLRQRRRERMRRAPPDLRRQAVAEVAERLDRAREQQGLAERHYLRLEALLLGLRQECLRIGRDHDAGDDLDAFALERGDLRRE